MEPTMEKAMILGWIVQMSVETEDALLLDLIYRLLANNVGEKAVG